MNNHKSPSVSSKLVDIRVFENVSALQLVNGYGDNSFRISGERFNGPIIIMPRLTISWHPPKCVNDLSPRHIVPHLGNKPAPLFILGVGDAPITPLNELAKSLKEVNISLELMSTAAACRTWNVLMSEGRSAAAGFYPFG